MAADSNAEKCTLLLTGYLRARNLSVNQLVIFSAFSINLVNVYCLPCCKSVLDQVHVSGAGDYQLCNVELLQDPCPLNVRKEADLMDSDEVHGEQVWCTGMIDLFLCLYIWFLGINWLSGEKMEVDGIISRFCRYAWFYHNKTLWCTNSKHLAAFSHIFAVLLMLISLPSQSHCWNS